MAGAKDPIMLPHGSKARLTEAIRRLDDLDFELRRAEAIGVDVRDRLKEAASKRLQIQGMLEHYVRPNDTSER